MSVALPLAGVGLAWVGWGIYTIPMKFKSVTDVSLDPVVFQLYQSVGICVVSTMLLLIPDVWAARAWTWYALLSASLWMPANLLTIFVVRNLGIAIGQAIWGGILALTSFVWGVAYFQSGMRDSALGTLGIVMLAVGISSLGFLMGRASKSDDREALIAESAAADAEAIAPPLVAERSRSFVRGLVLAVVVGLLFGSTMMPLRLAPEVPFRSGIHALTFAACFGISALGIALVIFAGYALGRSLTGREALPRFHLSVCGPPAAASGALWAIGNVGGTIACLAPLGLTVGYPSTQAAMILAGTIGIFVFKEVQGCRTIFLFYTCSAVLLVGASLLAIFGSSS